MKLSVGELVAVALVFGLAGCSGGGSSTSQASKANVVEIVAQGLSFTAPDEIPSGWNTFRFKNESNMTHFGVLERMPEGHGIEDHQRDLAPVFQEGMNLLNEGDTDAAMAKFGEIPAWFGQVVYDGGVGLTAPGRTSETTLYLEPGTYILECYVKTDGVFHSYNPSPSDYGMVHEFSVKNVATPSSEPKATLDLTLSSTHGIATEGEPVAGTNTIAVHFADQKLHENFSGHDVHLVRLTDDVDLDALEAWMNWMNPGGLQTPAPAEFLGGTEEMPAGQTAYVTVQLEPGRYAWISEVPNPQEQGMLKTFTVSAGE